MNKTNKGFEEALALLNVEQRQAVNDYEGPMMVVAGPGTGKTQVMGMRIANILHKTDTNPENILCLTFTDAATVALRKRLTQFIGSTAQRVSIHTYHSFANMVIQENKDMFGMTDLQLVSELELKKILRSIVLELPKEHALKRESGDIFYDVTNLGKLFSIMKQEKISGEDMSRIIYAFLEELATIDGYFYKKKYKDKKPGDTNAQFEKVKATMQKLEAAAGLFLVFQAKMTEGQRFDYNDMLLWVLDLFEKKEYFRLRYQEQYQYFLVDEYQDTNGAQNSLLDILTNYWEVPNLFVVGDDDQSIYKFQGANVENILHLYKKHEKHIKTVVLTKNYRSTQNILDASNALISNNKGRLVGQIPGLTKDIVATNDAVATIPQKVVTNEYQTPYQETVHIAQQVAQLIENGTTPNEIAILYKQHKQVEELQRYFEHQQIPFTIARAINILDIPIVVNLLNVLKYIMQERTQIHSGAHLLFSIMHVNIFPKLKAIDIAQLATLMSQNRLQWRTQIEEGLEKSTLSEDVKTQISEIFQLLETLIKDSFNITLQELFEKIIYKAGFLLLIRMDKDPAFQMNCVYTLFEYVKQETAKKPNLALSEFLEDIRLLHHESIPIRLERVVGDQNGVVLSSVHASKGLEYDHVFLIGCNEKMWDKEPDRSPFGLNKLIARGVPTLDVEEARRLFYVALTRAKRKATISYSTEGIDGKPINPASFIAELNETSAKEKINISADASLAFFEKSFGDDNAIFKDITQDKFVNKRLENYSLNATDLNLYLRCPITFFYERVLRIPRAKNQNTAFGTAIHNSLDWLVRTKNTEKEFPSADDLANRFVYELQLQKDGFTDDIFEIKLDYGSSVLKEYYHYNIANWKLETNVKTEVRINTELNQIPLNGVLDKVVYDGDKVSVTDYKTGKIKNEKIKRPQKSDAEIDPQADHQKKYGGDYWRQLVFYKILVENHKSFSNYMNFGQISYVEPQDGVFKNDIVSINSEDVATVTKQITETYQGIMNKEFTHGCGKEDCQWCTFSANLVL